MNKTRQVIIQLFKTLHVSNLNTKIQNEACTPVLFFFPLMTCVINYLVGHVFCPELMSFKDTVPLSTCRCLVSSLYRTPAAEMEENVQLTDFRTLRRSSSVGDLDNCEYLKLACLRLILHLYVHVTYFIATIDSDR